MPLPTHASPTLCLSRIFLRPTLLRPVILPILHPALYRLSPVHNQIRTIIKVPKNPHPRRREHWDEQEIDGNAQRDDNGIPFVEGKVTAVEMRRRAKGNGQGMKAYFVDGQRRGGRYEEAGRNGGNRYTAHKRPHEMEMEKGSRGGREGSKWGNMQIDKDGFVKDMPDRTGKSIDELARMDRRRYGPVASNPNWSEAMDRIQEIRTLQHEHETFSEFMDQYEAGEIVDVEATTPAVEQQQQQQQQQQQPEGVASVEQAQKLMVALTETPGSSLFKAKEEQDFQDRKALKSKSAVDKELPFQTDTLVSTPEEVNPEDQPYELPEEQMRFEQTLTRLTRNKPIKTKPLPPLPETDWRGSTKKEIFKRLPEWLKHKYTMQKKLMGRAWSPRRKLSPDVMDAIRELQDRFPDMMMTPVLAEQFGVSIESIRRILKGGRWKPTPEEQAERMERWNRRGELIRQAKIQAGQWTSKENEEYEKQKAAAKKLNPKKEKREKKEKLKPVNSMESKKEVLRASEMRMNKNKPSFFEDEEQQDSVAQAAESSVEDAVEIYEVEESPQDSSRIFETVTAALKKSKIPQSEETKTEPTKTVTETLAEFPSNVTFAPSTESSPTPPPTPPSKRISRVSEDPASQKKKSTKTKAERQSKRSKRLEEHQEKLLQLDFWRKRSGFSDSAPWDKRARYDTNPAEIFREKEERKNLSGLYKKKEKEEDSEVVKRRTEAHLERLVQEEDANEYGDVSGYRVRNRML